MGIFTRMRDIINSNINAMLEKAEDPEKMIRLMIQEMEDTLIDIKAQCASAMAHVKTFSRQLAEANEKAEEWERKARLAMEKGREALAREALLEKRHYAERVEAIAAQKRECEALIEQYQKDMQQLEEKMASAREKQKVLVQRHMHATTKRRAQTQIRKADIGDVFAKFDGFERRVDRMEAEADLVNFGRKPSVHDEFEQLVGDEQIEAEMEALRKEVEGKRER
jgi:phage shock protein A